jgi:hypothetical protein
LVAVELDRLIAFRYDVTMPRGFHDALLCIAARQERAAYVRVQCARGLPDSLHFAAVPSTESHRELFTARRVAEDDRQGDYPRP